MVHNASKVGKPTAQIQYFEVSQLAVGKPTRETIEDMRPPRRRAAQRRARKVARTEKLFCALELLDLLDELELDELKIEELEPNIIRRRSLLILRTRRPWATYIRPMLGDGTFKYRVRLDYDGFMVLVELLRPSLQRDAKMGALRNGAVPVEYQLVMTLRWLAGASTCEGMDAHVIARSTACAIVHRVIDALNAIPRLDCKWPVGADALRSAELFKNRGEQEVIRKSVGAMDGLFAQRGHAWLPQLFS